METKAKRGETKRELAPVLVSVYDRPSHLKKCIEALVKNPEAERTDLFIVSDAACCREHEEKIREVRTYMGTIKGFKRVIPIIRESNMGAFHSMNRARDEVINAYGSLIAMEDDIVVSHNFLRFMNQALVVYEERPDVFSVAGFTYNFVPDDYAKDVYLSQKFCPWGMGLWKEKWNRARDYIFNPVSAVDLGNREIFDRIVELKGASFSHYMEDRDGRIMATDARVPVYMIKHGLYTLAPKKTLVNNIGFDGSGLHLDTRYHVGLLEFWEDKDAFEMPPDLEPDPLVEAFDANRKKRKMVMMVKRVLIKAGFLYFVLDARRAWKRFRLKRRHYRM